MIRSRLLDPRQARKRSPKPRGRPRGEAARKIKTPPVRAARKKKAGRRGPQTAQDMAKRQRSISVSEFFAKNRHLLGYDNPKKAMLTTIKEAVDNALDACEEAHILPEISIEIRATAKEERFIVTVTDNGPGIVEKQIPQIFGQLLYGSKFHRLKMSRGQQGIGISAAGMYGMLTTGKAVRVWSSTTNGPKAQYFEIQIDTSKNEPVPVKKAKVDWDHGRGTRVQIELVARLSGGRQSVKEYIEQTAVANPHATFRYRAPGHRELVHPRATETLPEETREIKPHPRGVELGVLMKMLKDTKVRTLVGFLHQEFSRVSMTVGGRVCDAAKLSRRARPRRIAHQEAETLYRAIQETKFMNPPTDCLAPIGERQILAGLSKQIDANFYTAVTRPPAVYRGNPFQIEVGLAYGSGRPEDEDEEDEDEPIDGKNGKNGKGGEKPVRLLRFANRAPLLYQGGACAITEAVTGTAWRNYGLTQPRGSLPQGPMALMVHMASVWVPFTSESKEAVAHYDIIIKEIKLALREAGRRLNTYLRKRKHVTSEAKRRGMFELYIEEVVDNCASLLRVNRKELTAKLARIAKKRTEAADENPDNVPKDDDDEAELGASSLIRTFDDAGNAVTAGPAAEDGYLFQEVAAEDKARKTSTKSTRKAAKKKPARKAKKKAKKKKR